MDITGEGFRIWSILSTKLLSWLHEAVAIFPNLIVAAAIMVLTNFAAKGVCRLIGRVLGRTSESVAVTRLVESSVRLLILFAGLFTSLGILNLDKTVGSLLAGAGVIGLAIGFAFQEIAANFFSGILIALRKPFALGDIVQVDVYVGTVVDMTLRTTNLSTGNGLVVLIPNKDMFTKPVTNYTSMPGRRIELKFGVAYNSDLEKVEKVAKQSVEGVGGRQKDKPIEFYYTGFGDSAINCLMYIWVEFPANNYFQVGAHQAIIFLKNAFAANDISMPFPTSTLDFASDSVFMKTLAGTAAPATPNSAPVVKS